MKSPTLDNYYNYFNQKMIKINHIQKIIQTTKQQNKPINHLPLIQQIIDFQYKLQKSIPNIH